MTLNFPTITISLPDWLTNYLESRTSIMYPTAEDRMRLAITIAELNIQHGTGGPFGAAIFNQSTNELVAPGVNLVLSAQNSVLHAEIVAIMMAQKMSGTFDLGKPGLPPFELVASTAPCAMCLGALPWSGIKQLLCGARDEDAREIGFDEGAKVDNWIEELNKRSIAVVTDICRDEAKAVLSRYRAMSGTIYNANHA